MKTAKKIKFSSTSNPLLSQTFVDPSNIKMWDNALINMQGNILKGHGRDHTTHLFLKFADKSKNDVKDWLKKFAAENVTNFKKQLQQREIFKRNGIPGGLFCNLFITKQGLEYFEKITQDQTPFTDTAFSEGMATRKGNPLNENTDAWEKPLLIDWHMMILVAHDDEQMMGEFVKSLLEEQIDIEDESLLTTTPKGLHIEYGHVIRNANGDGLEHNGYVDGISQPLFLKDEQDAYRTFHDIVPDWENASFDPRAAPGLVLFTDPFVDSKDAFGSYFVFRKLEQNVKGFKTAEKEVGLKLFPNSIDATKREVAGAYIVGRFEDGTPVTLSKRDGMIGSGKFNDFNYDIDDKAGSKCPHFAHIRKTNPRATDPTTTNAPIMARRGIPFGRREVDTVIDPLPQQSPEDGVGLLFMSYQASLEKQFEVIQKGVFETTKPIIEADPLLGITTQTTYQFPNTWDTSKRVSADFNQFITMLGGCYFYAPSLPFFETL